MSTATTSSPPTEDRDRLRDEWLTRLTSLIERVEVWAVGQGWSARRIDKKLEEPALGTYRAPALLLQEGVTRIILEPIARSAPGVDGVVDLYQLPAYDDIATLFAQGDNWWVRYPLPADPVKTRDEMVERQPLTAAVIEQVLKALVRDAA